MEIRTLRCFLEVARTGNMTRAAERLHLSQPTLSKIMRELEEELQQQLFVRKRVGVELTEKGCLLRQQARDLVNLAEKIEQEFQHPEEEVTGTIYIGCAESELMKYLARAMRDLKAAHPRIQYRLMSGDTEQVTERLDRGVMDFGFLVDLPDHTKYDFLEIPYPDTFGVLMPADHPLAAKKAVTLEDLKPYPLFTSRQSFDRDLPRWDARAQDELQVLFFYNLINNAAIFVREGLGLALTLENILELNARSSLCFRPLEPNLEVRMYMIWRKDIRLGEAAQLLLARMKEMMEQLKADSGSDA